MDNVQTATDHRLLSGLLVGFGAYTLAVTAIGTLIFDALIIDVGGIIVIWLGYSLSGGSAKIAKWSRILMLYYIVMAAVLLAVCAIAPEQLRLGGRPIRPEEMPYTALLVGIAGIWAGMNLAILWVRRAAFAVPPEKTA